jgi:hypothetical protein
MRRRTDTETSTITAECTAFLDGHYVEYLTGTGGIPPAWTWVNLLAHGTTDELETASRPGHGYAAGSWTMARAFLCREVLDIAARTGTLSALQQEALVPLELRLISSEPMRIWNSGTLVQLVIEELERYRQTVSARARRAGHIRP